MSIIEVVRDMMTRAGVLASEATTPPKNDQAGRLQMSARREALNDVLQLLKADPLLRAAPFERVERLVNGLHKDLVEQAVCEEDQNTETIKAVIQNHFLSWIALHQRVFDLLRDQRGDLLEAKLITREEYGWLSAEGQYFEAGDPNIPNQMNFAPRRLESYQDNDLRMRVMAARIGRVVVTCPHCGPYPDKPVCGQCKQLKAILQDYLRKDLPMGDPAAKAIADEARRWEQNADEFDTNGNAPAASRARARAESYRHAADILGKL